MSCSSAARRRSRRSSRVERRALRRSPIANAATRSECLAVNGDLASITPANAPRSRSSRVVVDESMQLRRPSSRSGRQRRPRRAGAQKLASSLEHAERARRAPGRTSSRAASRAVRRRPSVPPARREDLDGLRQAEDPAEQRDRLARAGRAAGRGRPSARRACGSPRPSSSEKPSSRAISAPRSQRVSNQLARDRRLASPSRAALRPARRGDACGATVRTAQIARPRAASSRRA